MKSKAFTVKLDKPTAEKLARLAKTTERTQGDVIRLLIRRATPEFESAASFSVAEVGASEPSHAHA